MTFVDPIDPPDAEDRMNAADLKNKVCLIRPFAEGEWPAKEAGTNEDGTPRKAQGPRPYIETDVWVLDRAGIVESGTGIRISWWRAVEQLRPVEFGEFLLAMPMEQADRSVILVKTSKQEWRDIAATAVKEITSDQSATVNTGTSELDALGDEPF